MLCSHCSSVVRPIVAVDMDGTMGDYHGHFLRFAEDYLGSRRKKGTVGYMGEGDFKDWFSRAYGVDVTTFRQIKLAYRQGAQKRTMPAHDGMPQMVTALSVYGVEVWITTTRPYLRLDGIDPDTREWLRRHRVTYHGLLYDEDKYEVLARNVNPERVIAVIDDLPEQYDAAAKAFGANVPILYHNQYNTAVVRPTATTRVDYLWLDLTERIQAWQAVHTGAQHA